MRREIGAKTVARRLHARVVRLADCDALRRAEEQVGDFLLAGQPLDGLAGALDLVGVAALADPDEAALPQADERGGEAAVVAVHAVDVARARGPEAGRRIVAGKLRPGARIAADQRPAPPQEREQQRETGQPREHAAVVAEPQAQARRERRRSDDAFREAEHDREPLACRKPARGAELAPVRGRARLVIAAGRAEIPGVGLEPKARSLDRGRQRDLSRERVERESPAVAVHVPVQLVVLLEKAELARGAVADRVDVPPGRKEHARAADADPHAVREPLERVGLGRAVARHFEHVELHAHQGAGAVAVVGREVAQDAAPDLAAARLDRDRLGDGERALGVDADVAVEFEDALLRRSRGRNEHREEQEQRSHSATFTASRSSVSKNGMAAKPNRRATSTSGKDSIRVTYCLTAPL